jgi:hypothetical protein
MLKVTDFGKINSDYSGKNHLGNTHAWLNCKFLVAMVYKYDAYLATVVAVNGARGV